VLVCAKEEPEYKENMKADGQTWDEDVHRYLDEKRSQTVPMEPVFRMTRDKSHLWRGEELKYDPLMQVLRDPDAVNINIYN
jgi:hypothetical protein